MIHKLHHSAYRCLDSEATRAFYEDFLGLPLAGALRIARTQTGRDTDVLHSFYRMDDGSFIAFFEAPDQPFGFKPQHDFDLHLALEVQAPTLALMLARARDAGVEARGIASHGFIDSIYLRDPNGYVVELCARRPGHDREMDPAHNGARATLDEWTRQRRRGAIQPAAAPDSIAAAA